MWNWMFKSLMLSILVFGRNLNKLWHNYFYLSSKMYVAILLVCIVGTFLWDCCKVLLFCKGWWFNLLVIKVCEWLFPITKDMRPSMTHVLYNTLCPLVQQILFIAEPSSPAQTSRLTRIRPREHHSSAYHNTNVPLLHITTLH